jgi:uncharacterized protein DUF2513
MQAYEWRSPVMQRDMDLVRELLLQLDNDARLDGTRWANPAELGITDQSPEKVAYHLRMLIGAGFITGKVPQEGVPLVSKLTWQGHEFLDDIRDPEIWTKTKEQAKGLASVGIALIWELAKALIRQKLGLPQ